MGIEENVARSSGECGGGEKEAGRRRRGRRWGSTLRRSETVAVEVWRVLGEGEDDAGDEAVWVIVKLDLKRKGRLFASKSGRRYHRAQR